MHIDIIGIDRRIDIIAVEEVIDEEEKKKTLKIDKQTNKLQTRRK